MSGVAIFAEFIGGPLDGTVTEIDGAMPTIYVPTPPMLLGRLGASDPSEIDVRTLCYERSERKRTGYGWLFRYRLITPTIEEDA